jgi:ATP-dependent exoDNAse (exonuclease V) beta subunit
MSFLLYKASAGSGKTYTLVKEYLKIVLPQAEKYKNILAVTFTNKAAAEMKERIIQRLHGLARGKERALLDEIQHELQDETGKRIDSPREMASNVLNKILHDYSNFAIMTIDSFVYRIVKSFALELRLPLSFDVELNLTALKNKMVDSLVDLAGEPGEKGAFIERILTQFVLSKLREGESWKFEKPLRNVSGEIFKEQSVADVKEQARVDHENFINVVISTREHLLHDIRSIGDAASGLVTPEKDKFKGGLQSGVQADLVKLNGADTPQRIHELAERLRTRNLSLKETFREGKEWKQLLQKLETLRQKALAATRNFLTLDIIRQTMYTCALLGKFADLVEDYKKKNNIIPISDFNRLVADIILEEAVPFIYYRIGDKYEHYLVDEFQDTSRLQWQNLFPLIENATAKGLFSMSVGDGKQAIYRWRGGDIGIIERDIPAQMKTLGYTERPLGKNFRSLKNIVCFNNMFFSRVREFFRDCPDIGELYAPEKTRQEDKGEPGGFVRVSFLGETGCGKAEFQKCTLAKTVETIEQVRHGKTGYALGDIAVLVRENADGSAIAQRLFERGIAVVSPDSLLLNGQPAIRFLTVAVRYLAKGEQIDLFHMLHFLSNAKEQTNSLEELLTAFEETGNRQNSETYERLLPTEFLRRRARLARLPLYEAVEEIAEIFGLTTRPEYAGYIQSFLDCVHSFSAKNNEGIAAFLEWWTDSCNEEKGGPALVMPEGKDAVSIMTIHKAKGLEFPIVIVPFADWELGFRRGTSEQYWLAPQQDTAGVLWQRRFLVRPAKNVRGSLFAGACAEEEARHFLDNLNLLYVALTRAREELHVFAPAPAGKESPSAPGKSVPELLFSVLQAMSNGEGWITGANEYRYGTRTARRKLAESAPQEAGSRPYVSEKWDHRINLRQLAKRLWKLDQPERAEKVEQGILLHSVLSAIECEEDLPQVLEEFRQRGELGDAEKEAIGREIQRMFEVPVGQGKVRDWFKKGLVVRTEREIVTDRKILRPDRVVLEGERATVIDYKTGKEETEHQRNLREYAECLQAMGYKEVERYLLYLAPPKAVRV